MKNLIILSTLFIGVFVLTPELNAQQKESPKKSKIETVFNEVSGFLSSIAGSTGWFADGLGKKIEQNREAIAGHINNRNVEVERGGMLPSTVVKKRKFSNQELRDLKEYEKKLKPLKENVAYLASLETRDAKRANEVKTLIEAANKRIKLYEFAMEDLIRKHDQRIAQEREDRYGGELIID